MRFKQVLSALSVLLLVGTATFAEEDSGFSGNVSLVSDYSFRGVSQTGLLPAVQGGFDYETEGGFSFGTWASNVNYGDGTSQELDFYVGYSTALTDSTSLGFTAIQLEYPGEGEYYDYQEFAASLDMSSFSLGFVYSPNYVGVDDLQFTYLSAGYSASLGESGSLDLSVGLNNFDNDEFLDGDSSYIDYSIGVSAPFQGIDVGVAVVGTDLDAGSDSDGRLILSLSKSL